MNLTIRVQIHPKPEIYKISFKNVGSKGGKENPKVMSTGRGRDDRASEGKTPDGAKPSSERIPISIRTASVTAYGGLLGLIVIQVVIALWSPNAWWFFVSAFTAGVLADIVTVASERAYKERREQWVFSIKFAFFALAMISGAVVGGLAQALIKISLFNASQSIGFYAFWILTAFLPIFLFLDFYFKSRFSIIQR